MMIKVVFVGTIPLLVRYLSDKDLFHMTRATPH